MATNKELEAIRDAATPQGVGIQTNVDKFGEEPAAQSVMGYVMADLLVKSLEAAGPDVTVEKMIAGLEGIGQYDNPFGGRFPESLSGQRRQMDHGSRVTTLLM